MTEVEYIVGGFIAATAVAALFPYHAAVLAVAIFAIGFAFGRR